MAYTKNEQGEEISADSMEIFLSGNSSKSKRFQKLFEEKINELELEILKNTENKEKVFNINYPIEINKNKSDLEINAKTGTAIGLLESREGGRFKIVARDEVKNNNEINFQYFVGYLKNRKLKVILDSSNGYENWIKVSDASIREKEIYYIASANSIEGEVFSDNSGLRRKYIKIGKEYLEDEIFIYIQAFETDKIRYCVSTDKKIKKEEYIEEPRELLLV